jgi:hypothetical protein
VGRSPAFGSLLVLLFVLGVVLALVAFALAWAGRRRAVRSASCGSCGYAVAGLEGMRCPECGADLREAGIVTPASSGLVPPVMLAVMLGLAWTMLLPFPALVVTKLIVDSRPRTYTASSTFELSSPRGGFRSIVIQLTGEGPNANLRSYTHAELRELGESGGPDRIAKFALPEMGLAEGDGVMDAAYLAGWLIPPDDGTEADLDMAAGELMKQLRGGMQGGGIMIHSPASYTSGRTSMKTGEASPLPGWVIPSLVAPWILIWLVLMLVVRRVSRRRRLRASAAA